MATSYVYKITFEEVPHFYFGVRKRSPSDDPYMGTPTTNRHYWEIYTPKKQIFAVYDSWEKASDVELALIRQNITNKYCLNARCGNGFSPSAHQKGRRVFSKRMREDQSLRKKISNNLNKTISEKRESDPAYDRRYRDKQSLNAKKSAKGKIWITNGELSRMVFPESGIPDGWRRGRTISQTSQMITERRTNYD